MVEGDGVAAVAGHRRAGPVGRQRQFLRHAGQRAAPVGQLLAEHAVRVGLLAQQLALPQRVVGVLHRQRRPAAAPARGNAPRTPWTGPGPAAPSTSRPRRCGAAPAPARARPAAPRTARPGAAPPRQVERVPRRLGHSPGQSSGADLDHRQLDHRLLGTHLQDVLERLAVHGGTPCAAPRAGPTTSPQRRRSAARSSAPQPQRDGHVVGRARALQLIEEPQPLLRERQRQHLRTGPGHATRHGPCPPPPAASPARPPSAPRTTPGSAVPHPTPCGPG